MKPSQVFTRRNFLRSVVGGTAIAGGMYGWATEIEPHWVAVTDHAMPMRNLPHGLAGKTLVQISDLHIGSTDEAYLLSTIDTVNSLCPDIIVVTGDIIDHYFPNAIDAVTRVFAALRPGSIATIGCLGNHDYGRRWSDINVAAGVADAMNDLGIPILRDQRVDIAGLPFFGLDDLWTPKFYARDVLRSADDSVDSVCLCHNPDVCDRNVWSDFHGIVLAGHTHGGQCKPPWMSPPRLPLQNREYASGLFRLDENRRLYVNRGLGYGYKARFNCRPEITRFTLENL